LQAYVRSGVELAALFEGWVEAEDGWEVCAPRRFSVVCFRLSSDSGSGNLGSGDSGSDDRNRELLARVNASGEIFLSHAVLGGRYVLRLAVGQMTTTEDDVRRAWDVLRREAGRL
jgi:glutamate/tyrosine decarboxylase-like PLP-dependent enzyme